MIHTKKSMGGFRDCVDAENTEYLASVRRELKLTQNEATEITGGGPSAFSRDVRGAAKPLAAVLMETYVLLRQVSSPK